MQMQINLVIHGVASPDEIPGIDRIGNHADIYCAPNLESLQAFLPQAEVLLGWNFRAKDLQQTWHRAERLRWVQWSGAGVDAVLFPEFVASDVQLTNVRGVFDRAMAEYTGIDPGFCQATARDGCRTDRASLVVSIDGTDTGAEGACGWRGQYRSGDWTPAKTSWL
tara:strand:- start:8 stop:505 length:498 start_codon:yes stop_codon:yes gene_type:complete